MVLADLKIKKVHHTLYKAGCKGGVENDAKYTNSTFCPHYRKEERQKSPLYSHIEGMQQALESWCYDIAEERVDGEFGRRPMDIFHDEEHQARGISISRIPPLGHCMQGFSLVCNQGYRAMYRNTERLMDSLSEGKRNGSYLKLLEKIYKADVLILDDFGLSTCDEKARRALMDILEDRHGRKSTLILSQLPAASWKGLIGDTTGLMPSRIGSCMGSAESS